MKTKRYIGRIMGYAAMRKIRITVSENYDDHDMEDTGITTVGFLLRDRNGNIREFRLDDSDGQEHTILMMEKIEHMKDDMVEVTYERGNVAIRVKPFKPSIWFNLRVTLSSAALRISRWLAPDDSPFPD